MLHAFDEVLAAWNSHWFPGDVLKRGRMERARVAMSETWEGSRNVSVHATAEGRLRLVGRSLDMDVASLDQDLDDWKVVQAFSQALFADLAERFANLVGVDAPSYGGDWIWIQLADVNDQAVAAVKAPLEGALSARRKLAPPARGADTVMADLKAATGEVMVRLTASPGAAELTLDDLRRLTPGDIIVLDQGLKQPLMLQLDGAGAPVAAAMMIEGQGRRSLLLQASGRE